MTTRTRTLIISQGQAQAQRHHHCPRHLRPADILLGVIVGAGEGATITGRRITVSGVAVAVAVMVTVMVVVVHEAVVLNADK